MKDIVPSEEPRASPNIADADTSDIAVARVVIPVIFGEILDPTEPQLRPAGCYIDEYGRLQHYRRNKDDS